MPRNKKKQDPSKLKKRPVEHISGVVGGLRELARQVSGDFSETEKGLRGVAKRISGDFSKAGEGLRGAARRISRTFSGAGESLKGVARQISRTLSGAAGGSPSADNDDFLKGFTAHEEVGATAASIELGLLSIERKQLFEGDIFSDSFYRSQVDKTSLKAILTKKQKMFPASTKVGKGRTLQEVGVVINRINSRFKSVEELSQTSIYRTMLIEDAESLMNFGKNLKSKQNRIDQIFVEGHDNKAINKMLEEGDLLMPISGHLGSMEEASKYFDSGRNVALVQFDLKPGAVHEDILFSEDVLALQDQVKTSLLKTAVETKAGRAFTYQKATQNEGTLPGYLGIKAEGGDFLSLGIGNSKQSKLLFSTLLDGMQILHIKNS